MPPGGRSRDRRLAGERVLLGLRPAFDAEQPVEEGAELL